MNDLTFFVEFHLCNEEVLFFIGGVDRCPFTVK